ncbi:hypothetical protein [Glaciimonas soli]|uniref:Lipoprotein n=1 Tax=Glaciimonas soli TaxID=2590999 RepID=A0A843YX41_9BURK|nr:hypothetical protein [Glaciimonas soli]MQR01782.1 hypothetical protein [Glaciimonas soli]
MLKPSFLKCIFVISCVMTLLSGCFGFKPFQPAPYEFEAWKKQGVTPVDVQIALLECGYQDTLGYGSTHVRATDNEIVAKEKCMESDGFSKKDAYWRELCQTNKTLAACQSDAPHRLRNIQTRLDSQFCSNFPFSRVCLIDQEDKEDSDSPHDEITQQKKLLECGFATPYAGRGYVSYGFKDKVTDKVPSQRVDLSDNEFALAARCAVKSGLGNQYKNYCKKYPALSACNPDSPTPEPKIDRRLTSLFCKTSIGNPVCQ